MDFFKKLESELKEDIGRILHHPFVDRIRAGWLNHNQLQYFTGQYYIYCMHFPRFLAAAAANIPDDEIRMPIVENLWEEHGEGKLSGSHRILYHRYAQALDMSREELASVQALPTTAICCENLLHLCMQGSFIESLGALGPGTEYFTNEEYKIIAEGLQHYDFLSDDDLEFWLVHISLDEHHYSEMLDALRPFTHKAEDRYLIKTGARKAIDLELLFWDGLEDNLPGK